MYAKQTSNHFQYTGTNIGGLFKNWYYLSANNLASTDDFEQSQGSL